MADPQPKYARVNENNPEGWAQCDRCGFWYNRSDLVWQYEWAGMQLYNTGNLVCISGNNCYDTPQEQLRTIILPPDPPPIVNARVPNFAYEEYTTIQLNIRGSGRPGAPPWGAGPQLNMIDQTGTAFLTYQYPDLQDPS